MSLPIDIRGTRIVDLSQVYEPGIPCPPGQLPPELRVLSRTAEGGLTNSEAFSLGLHTGKYGSKGRDIGDAAGEQTHGVERGTQMAHATAI